MTHAHQSPSEKGSTLKERNCYQVEQILFLLEKIPLQKGGKNNFERVVSFDSVSYLLKFSITFLM